MHKLDWQSSTFQQLSNSRLYEIIKFRIDTFIVEQQCPYSELDNKDENSETRHVTAQINSKLIAYARILPPSLSYPEVSMGRFIVESNFRRQGIGSELIVKCLNEINDLWPDQNIKISAQKHLQKFYENFGFTKISDSYLEDGIPHISMLKTSKINIT